ncbi:MAG TPA: outer membrane beta-barrel protein [Chryseolinea sp.]|nr:outer membrane beta-barrel protein [Chryseolinea sp.]
MPKMTDQEFDDLFRQAANRISPDQGTGDWDDIQRRLEAAERDARARNISLYSIVALLLLYSFLMPENLKFGSYNHASVMPAMEQNEAGSMEESIIKREALTEGISNGEAGLSQEPSMTADQEANVETATSAAGTPRAEAGLLPSRALPAATVLTSGGDPIAVRSTATGGNRVLEALEVPSTYPLFAKPNSPDNFPMPAPGRITDVQGSVRHPWFVKLAISPDFSSIDFGGAGKTGLNVGPIVEYGISPRFSVSTGAIWSKKLYNQENPEKSYGQGGYPAYANMLNGDCRILDIPLNVTYYVLPGRKTNLFVTVGSSSYIMLDEEYVYTVTRNNRDYEYVENYSNKNNEWFSMLNLSVGVQHQVGKRWFVQGEPFLKAPMKGIGEGKVNLVSAGVFVSVKYWINPLR